MPKTQGKKEVEISGAQGQPATLYVNILSEKAAKKIHEAGNCELREVQQRTDKVQFQRCYSYIEAGFQVCPCGGKLNMSEEMLSRIRQNLSNSSQTPTRHSKVYAEPSMVLSHGSSITSLPKSL